MMSSEHFRAWRKALGWKQKEAADRLGLKKRMIQYYEKGDRDGKDVRIPKTVRLACYALAQGIDDFDGTAATQVPAPEAPPPKKRSSGRGSKAPAKKAAASRSRKGDRGDKANTETPARPDGAAPHADADTSATTAPKTPAPTPIADG